MNKVLSATCYFSASSQSSKVGLLTDQWSGTLFLTKKNMFCLTMFSPLVHLLPCETVKSMDFNDLNLIQCPSITCCVKLSQMYNAKGHFILDAKPIIAWKSLHFAKLSEELCWDQSNQDLKSKPDSVPENNCCDNHKMFRFLSWFLVCEVYGYNINDFEQLIINNTRQVSVKYNQGMDVWTCSCPFANLLMEVFSPCVSKGVLCLVSQNIMLLTDARCLPGSEGGGLYNSSLDYIGMIFSAIVLKTGEQTGFSLACSMYGIASSFMELYNHCKFSNVISKSLVNMFSKFSLTVSGNISPVHNNGPEVVIIENNQGWGSGVIVAISFDDVSNSAAVYVATCRHVALCNTASENSTLVRVKSCCGTIHTAVHSGNILYHSGNDAWLDFALVSFQCSMKYGKYLLLQTRYVLTNQGNSTFVINYDKMPQIGQDVIARGYTIFENHNSKPLFCKGNLSKIILHNFSEFFKDQAVLLHATCVVHVGMSGGGLFSKNHSLIGLVVNNMKEVVGTNADEYILYPTINFILPASLFMPFVLKFIFTKDYSILSSMNSFATNQWCGSIWMLNNHQDSDQLVSKL